MATGKKLTVSVGSDDRIGYEYDGEGDDFDAGCKKFQVLLADGQELTVVADYRGDWVFEVDLPKGAKVFPIGCIICDHDECICTPCPTCGEKDNDGVFHCTKCKKPACCNCACNSMHFGCEAEETGGLYIGPRPELD